MLPPSPGAGAAFHTRNAESTESTIIVNLHSRNTCLHTHKKSILASISQFKAQLISLEGMQRNLSAIEGAIEGDMSGAKEIRQMLHKADNTIELARFTMGREEAVKEVTGLPSHLEALIVQQENPFSPSAI